MINGERIDRLMKQRGLSQGELARRVGVKQPTIFKLIHENKTGSVHLHKVARELETSAAYLVNETDDPSIDASELALDHSDRELIELFNHLEPDDKKAVLRIMHTMAHSAKTPRVHSPKASKFKGPTEAQVQSKSGVRI